MEFHRVGCGRIRYRTFAVLCLACVAIVESGCSRKKDGILVELSDDTARSGVVIRDWRRMGLGALDVEIFTHFAIPSDAWTMAVYDRDNNLLTSGRIPAPRAREHDAIVIRLNAPYRDLFEKADRVVLDVQPQQRQVGRNH